MGAAEAPPRTRHLEPKLENLEIYISWNWFGVDATQINACSDALHNTEQFIDIQLTDANDALANERLASVISYLENINGAHRGLLRVSDSKSETSNETSELYFTISK